MGKILFLDSPTFSEPYVWRLQEQEGHLVYPNNDLTGLTVQGFDLVIFEPAEFGSQRGKSNLIPLLKDAGKLKIPRLMSSTQKPEDIQKNLGIGPKLYDRFYLKATDLTQFYKAVEEMVLA
jgi:hypothetical protein